MTFQLIEVVVPRHLFAGILDRITWLTIPLPPDIYDWIPAQELKPGKTIDLSSKGPRSTNSMASAKDLRGRDLVTGTRNSGLRVKKKRDKFRFINHGEAVAVTMK